MVGTASHITDDITSGIEPTGRPALGETAGFVAHLLEGTRERLVVEDVPGDVLHHPKPFGQSVQTCIDGPSNAHVVESAVDSRPRILSTRPA